MENYTGEEVKKILKHNFFLIMRLYRLGKSESDVSIRNSLEFEKRQKVEQSSLKEEKVPQEHFFNLGNYKETVQKDSFQGIVRKFYEQLENVVKSRDDVQINDWELLEMEILIFECLDFFLKPPPELKSKLIKLSDNVYTALKEKEPSVRIYKIRALNAAGIKQDSDAANNLSADSKSADNHDNVKLLILGALMGVGALYRNHTTDDNIKGWRYIQALLSFIEEDLPRLKGAKGHSFAILGLANFLAGQLSRTQAKLKDAERYFISAIEAYSERVIQNERVLRNKTGSSIADSDDYEEKRIVSLRRGALVNCLGLGYLYLITGQLTKGIAVVTYSRAVLRQVNSGAYNRYADLIYFALLRAKYSHKLSIINKVIDGLRLCRDDFAQLIPGSHYEARARLEIALALKYRADFSYNNKEKQEFYDDALNELKLAIKFARTKKNHHLLVEALQFSSHLRRLQPKSDLKGAERHARLSTKSGERFPQLYPDALLALAAVCTEKAKAHQKSQSKMFDQNFREALSILRKARRINKDRNARLTGIIYLRLVKVFSLIKKQGKIDSRSFYYFELWKEIANRVEHEFCHRAARDLEMELYGGNLLVLGNSKDLNYKKLNAKLLDHLSTVSIQNLAGEDMESQKKYQDDESLKQAIASKLIQDLGNEVNSLQLIEEFDLVEKYNNFINLEN
jgi:hypothetical protein